MPGRDKAAEGKIKFLPAYLYGSGGDLESLSWKLVQFEDVRFSHLAAPAFNGWRVCAFVCGWVCGWMGGWVRGASFRVNKPFSLSPFSQLTDADTPACFPATVEQKPFGAETATVCHWTPRKSINAAVCNTCSYTQGGRKAVPARWRGGWTLCFLDL